MVGLPSRSHSTRIQPSSAAAVATWVLTNAMRGDPVGGQLGTGVEAEPAEPQQAGAERDQRHVVRPEALPRPADPLAEHQRQGQGRRTGVDVHGGATGEVQARGSSRR